MCYLRGRLKVKNRNIMGLLTALNGATAAKHNPLEHVNVFCPGHGGRGWGHSVLHACQPALRTALFTFQKLNWGCQDADGAAAQRLLPSSLENILKVFVMKRAQRCPSLSFGEKDGSVFHLGGRARIFSTTERMIKGAYEKRQMAAVSLLGGPASARHIKPARDYFCVCQQFSFSRVRLIYEAIKNQSWWCTLIWAFSETFILCSCFNCFQSHSQHSCQIGVELAVSQLERCKHLK